MQAPRVALPAGDQRGPASYRGVVRLQISIAAFSAIASKLPAGVGFENKRAANGDWFIWLDHATVAKLKAMRGPGDSFSDVILALAKDERV